MGRVSFLCWAGNAWSAMFFGFVFSDGADDSDRMVTPAFALIIFIIAHSLCSVRFHNRQNNFAGNIFPNLLNVKTFFSVSKLMRGALALTKRTASLHIHRPLLALLASAINHEAKPPIGFKNAWN
jgi:hypothetical protein